MNKEEIEELKDFTIDITDIDELALGLEVCSKKSNMVIQEFANTIIKLQQENQQLKEELKYTVPIVEHNKIVSKKLKENQKYKEVIDKAIYFINNNGAKQYNHHDNYRGKWYSPDELDTIVDILKEVE